MVVKLSSISVLKPKKLIINPSELGYIRSDKKIAFQTSTAAEKYAKNVVIKELYGANPHEKGVILKDNIIIAELEGNKNEINLSSYNISAEDTHGASFIHGHTTMKNGYTTPLSLGDFFSMVAYQFKAMIAYNEKGESCRFDAIPKTNKLRKFLPEKVSKVFDFAVVYARLKDVFDKYIEMWTKLLPENIQINIKPLFHSMYSDSILVDKKLASKGHLLRQDKSLTDKIALEENILFNSLKGQRAIHEFWVNKSGKYGYNYSTNFSNLIEQ